VSEENDDTEEFCPDCFAGTESSEHHEKCEADRPAGYVIAERPIWGPDTGRLVIDWDGVVHKTRKAAEAELARANSPDEDDPMQEPADNWELYELWPVKP